VSKREEKAMRQRLEADRASGKSRYGGFIEEQKPERAAAAQRYGERYGELQKGFGGMAETGGIDPSEAARLRGGYRGFSETGGLDPGVSRDLGSFYGNMTKTGGYGAQDVANIRGRSNASIPAVFNRLKEGLRNRLVTTGGSSSGYNATLSKLGRQAAQDTATTARDTEVDIADRMREGRLTGAAGQFGLENAIRSGKLMGLQGGQGFEESLRTGRMAGLQGIGGLAGADIGQMQNVDANRLAAEGGITQVNQGTYSPDLSLATRPGWGANLMQGLGTAASLAAPFMGGINPLSMFQKPPLGGVAGPGAPPLPEYQIPAGGLR
jgi:hypothetical protein